MWRISVASSGSVLTSTSSTTRHSADPGEPAQLRSLTTEAPKGRSVTGMPPQCEVIRRGDPEYEGARRATCRNRHLPDRYPDVIVQATTEEDVVAAIRMAAASGWKVGVRSGGHSFSCNHVREGGMLLDVSRLNDVTIDATGMVATAGPGCRSNELDDLLAERDLFFPVGHCQGVGLGGYLLQGGFGWHSRAVGPACETCWRSTMSAPTVSCVTQARARTPICIGRRAARAPDFSASSPAFICSSTRGRK